MVTASCIDSSFKGTLQLPKSTVAPVEADIEGQSALKAHAQLFKLARSHSYVAVLCDRIWKCM